MGIQREHFYFKQGLPKVNVIKAKFEEITGLYLSYTSCLQLNELITDEEDVLRSIEQSVKGPHRHIYRRPYFSCAEFDDVYLGEYLQPETKSFDLECGIRIENMYFFQALIKAMLELGGRCLDYSFYSEDDRNIDDYLEPYLPHQREWKRIKNWNEMNAVERAGFNNPYI